MEVAGKIIYKWAIYTMAMLNNQRVYTSISQASFINQPAESLLWCTPPPQPSWPSPSTGSPLATSLWERGPWAEIYDSKKHQGNLPDLYSIWSIIYIYISKHDSYHDFDIFPMPGQCLKRSAYPCMSQNYSSLMRKLCSSARIEASFFFKQPHFIIKSANNWRDRSFLTYRRPNLHQINLWGGHVEVESTRWLATRKNAGFRLKNPPSRASGWLHLPAIGAARLYASPVIPNGSCQGKTPHGTGWNHLFFQQENTINGVFNFSCLSVID